MQLEKLGTFFLTGLVLLLSGIGVTQSILAVTASAPLVAESEKLPTIVIDAGHGGFDGGAVGVDGLVEKDINLAIAKKLYDLFLANGFEVRLTRDSDCAIYDPGTEGLRRQKNSDIHNRLKIATDEAPSILLSIHQNKFQAASSFGAQVFYGPKNPESEALGALMQERLREWLQPENKRQPKRCTDSVYLIYNAPMPALLVECGFLSNAEDAKKLTDSEYQRRVAFAIFSAVAEYFSLGAQTEQPSELERPVELAEAT